MIGIFVRLKLTLLLNAMRRPNTAFGLTIFTLSTIILGLSLASWLITLSDRSAIALSPLIAAVFVVGWLIAPLLFGAADETIDTSRLALFPLNPAKLARGMATAALVGPGPIAALIPLVGLSLRSPNAGNLGLSLLAAVTTIVLATSFSRLALTALGAGLRQRKSRDRATLAAGLAAGTVAVFGQAFVFAGETPTLVQIERLSTVIRLTPIGWSGDALGRASSGQVLVPIIELVATWAIIVVIMRAWVDVLNHVLENVEESGETSELKGHLLTSDQPGTVRPTLAVLAKERRYLKRHPRYRVQVASQAIVLVVGGAPFLGAIIDKDPRAVLFGCIPGLTAGVTGSNLLGPDGRALWGEASALGSLKSVLRGRSLAFALLGLVAATLVTLASAAWTGGWQFVPTALGAAVGMALAGSGIGAMTSVLAPTPYPDDSSPNPFATSSPGGGCINGLITMIGVFTGLGFVVPILAGLAWSRESVAGLVVVAVTAPFYGLALWLATTRIAGRRADKRIPELISVLSAH